MVTMHDVLDAQWMLDNTTDGGWAACTGSLCTSLDSVGA